MTDIAPRALPDSTIPSVRRRPPSLGARIATGLWRCGVFDHMARLRPRTLVVAAYHRIAVPDEVARHSFAENVSATPAAFLEQMRYLATRFNVISGRTLVQCLRGEACLPPRAALVTFDDGYRDNYDTALPILRGLGVPATLFVATDCIGSGRPFHWDLAAHCFGHARRGEADLPVLGPRRLHGAAAREAALREWIAAMKRLPDDGRRAAVDALPAALGVSVPDDAFADLHLSWEQLAEMSESVFDIGAHTLSHPILSRVSLERAQQEIRGSKRRIEERLGVPVTAFAYPNGQAGDFGPEHEFVLREAGFDAAFTTQPGPASYDEVFGAPMRIRRVGVTHRDTLARFAAKVSGFTRMVERLRAAPARGAVPVAALVPGGTPP